MTLAASDQSRQNAPAGCPDCTLATTNCRTGHYSANCLSCKARMLAQSPAAHDAYVYQAPAHLKALMRQEFPTAEQYRQGRIEVDRWWKTFNGHATERADLFTDAVGGGAR